MRRKMKWKYAFKHRSFERDTHESILINQDFGGGPVKIVCRLQSVLLAAISALANSTVQWIGFKIKSGLNASMAGSSHFLGNPMSFSEGDKAKSVFCFIVAIGNALQYDELILLSKHRGRIAHLLDLKDKLTNAVLIPIESFDRKDSQVEKGNLV